MEKTESNKLNVRIIIFVIVTVYYFYSVFVLNEAHMEFGLIVFIISILIAVRAYFLKGRLNIKGESKLRDKYTIVMCVIGLMFLLFFISSKDPFDLNLAAFTFYIGIDGLYGNLLKMRKDYGSNQDDLI